MFCHRIPLKRQITFKTKYSLGNKKMHNYSLKRTKFFAQFLFDKSCVAQPLSNFTFPFHYIVTIWSKLKAGVYIRV